MNSRILALDLGKKRIGFAISDPLGITAQGLPTYTRGNIREDRAFLQRITKEWDVQLFLLGNPLHMSGKESHGSRHARDFGDRLTEWTGLPAAWYRGCKKNRAFIGQPQLHQTGNTRAISPATSRNRPIRHRGEGNKIV